MAESESYLERCLVRHCSPTLANIKPGSLFTCPSADTLSLAANVRALNSILNRKGICLRLLNISSGRALVYVYRPKMLHEYIEKEEVCEFLCDSGYDCKDVRSILSSLQRKIAEDGVPHEIGLFLGYPLEDVKGFIENKGRNYLCRGCWKVYCDKCEAQRVFKEIRLCRQLYLSEFEEGRSVADLTIYAD